MMAKGLLAGGRPAAFATHKQDKVPLNMIHAHSLSQQTDFSSCASRGFWTPELAAHSEEHATPTTEDSLHCRHNVGMCSTSRHIYHVKYLGGSFKSGEQDKCAQQPARLSYETHTRCDWIGALWT